MVLVERIRMTIKPPGRRRSAGLILVTGGSGIRVSPKEADDSIDFTSMAATSVSETCFKWALQHRYVKESVLEKDCICPKELAVRLIHLLFDGCEPEGWTTAVAFELTQDSVPPYVN